MHQIGENAARSTFGDSAAPCELLSLLVRQVETVVGSDDGDHDKIKRARRQMDILPRR